MPRLLVVHWKPAEAAAGIEALRRAGHEVEVYSTQGGAGLKELRAAPPEALLIDQSRLPSHGREVADYFRRTKATRSIPLVFIGGAEEKLARTRQLFPGAVYCDWRRVRGAVREALRRRRDGHAAADPAPGGIPGYSGTPLPRKLGFKAGTTTILVDAPPGFERLLKPLPKGVGLRRGARGRARLVILFAPDRAALARRFPAAVKALEEGGRLWLAWPKKAGRLASDLTQAEVRRHAMDRGLVDFKICSIDTDWSGLAFARR